MAVNGHTSGAPAAATAPSATVAASVVERRAEQPQLAR
eukprot:COSAG04_NODE_5143_length_1721_cov_71.471023_1_plen_37_part_10